MSIFSESSSIFSGCEQKVFPHSFQRIISNLTQKLTKTIDQKLSLWFAWRLLLGPEWLEGQKLLHVPGNQRNHQKLRSGNKFWPIYGWHIVQGKLLSSLILFGGCYKFFTLSVLFYLALLHPRQHSQKTQFGLFYIIVGRDLPAIRCQNRTRHAQAGGTNVTSEICSPLKN